MTTVCSNNFFDEKNIFCSNFVFFSTTYVADKNYISYSELIIDFDHLKKMILTTHI
jgi:hypothetical protein